MEVTFVVKTPEAPVGPVTPEAPVGPEAPNTPEAPVAPLEPHTPLAPVGPVTPEAPVGPVTPNAFSPTYGRRVRDAIPELLFEENGLPTQGDHVIPSAE